MIILVQYTVLHSEWWHCLFQLAPHQGSWLRKSGRTFCCFQVSGFEAKQWFPCLSRSLSVALSWSLKEWFQNPIVFGVWHFEGFDIEPVLGIIYLDRLVSEEHSGNQWTAFLVGNSVQRQKQHRVSAHQYFIWVICFVIMKLSGF